MGIVKFCTLKLSTEEKKIGLVTIPEDKLNFNFKIWPRVFFYPWAQHLTIKLIQVQFGEGVRQTLLAIKKTGIVSFT